VEPGWIHTSDQMADTFLGGLPDFSIGEIAASLEKVEPCLYIQDIEYSYPLFIQ